MAEKQWGVYPQDSGDVIVLPIDDAKEHDMLSAECPCMPQVMVLGSHIVITHNAFDFRHVNEWLAEAD